MTSIAKTRGDIEIVPSNLVVDGMDGMPQNSGTHFNHYGARQFAGASYAWLKAKFAAAEQAASKAAVAQVKSAAAAKDAKTAVKPAAAPPEKKGWIARIKSYFGG